MVSYKQLELFDLRPYTSKQPKQSAVVCIEEKQFEEVSQSVKYEQLELDLFPEQSEPNHVEFVKLAA